MRSSFETRGRNVKSTAGACPTLVPGYRSRGLIPGATRFSDSSGPETRFTQPHEYN
jgi:hypothetical protein